MHKDTPDLCYGESDIYNVESYLRWYEKYVRDAVSRKSSWSPSKNANKLVDNLNGGKCNFWGDQNISFKQAIEAWYDTGNEYSWKRGHSWVKPDFIYLVNSKATEINCGFYYHGKPLGNHVYCQIWPKSVHGGINSPTQYYKSSVQPLKNPDVDRPLLIVNYLKTNETFHNLIRNWEKGYRIRINDDTFRWESLYDTIPEKRKFDEKGIPIDGKY